MLKLNEELLCKECEDDERCDEGKTNWRENLKKLLPNNDERDEIEENKNNGYE